MFPYKTTLQLHRASKSPLYLQLANQIIDLIKLNRIQPKTRLPSSRLLAQLLDVHRKTVVACYDELQLQGWIESIPKKGTYVTRNLPVITSLNLNSTTTKPHKKALGFKFYNNSNLTTLVPFNIDSNKFYVNDGIGDVRLTPTNELARIYRRIAARKHISEQLTYGSTFGNVTLRKVLVNYLNETRGLSISKEQILITRGSQMGLFLAAQLLLKPKDCIIIGDTNYATADLTFMHQQAMLIRVKVDEEGIDTSAIAAWCKNKTIKAVYVTPHHHHPTTVTMSAKRRLQLLNLAKTYKFAIIEDDYDYDFNYNHAPILPLASHDTHGHVIYIGSICKTVAPVYRVGYLIAPEAFVTAAANLRRILDRQGDALLELTFAEFIKNGDLTRHIKKVLKKYRARRDLFCKLLSSELPDFFTFEIPKGGMAVWVTLNKNYSWDQVSKLAIEQNLIIGNWRRYDTYKQNHNAIRIGFASYNETEIESLIHRFKVICKMLKG